MKKIKVKNSALPIDPQKLSKQMGQTVKVLVSKIPRIRKKRSA